ncbi:MAG: hypothetical protein KAJ91_02185 [Candidatus Aenigmarchaeota archaeon]|nr:hypothetical protein [Candidatus Aenigmarchaeota archaeon]
MNANEIYVELDKMSLYEKGRAIPPLKVLTNVHEILTNTEDREPVGFLKKALELYINHEALP